MIYIAPKSNEKMARDQQDMVASSSECR